MTVTQRGQLSEADQSDLIDAVSDWRRAEEIRDRVRVTCVEMVERSSFRAVSEATGFSPTTLQKWKREAAQ